MITIHRIHLRKEIMSPIKIRNQETILIIILRYIFQETILSWTFNTTLKLPGGLMVKAKRIDR